MRVGVYIRKVNCNEIHSIYCNLSRNNSVTTLQFDNLLLNKISFDMPSTRKQKAKEKRSRQSDVMSDIENLDVMLGNYANGDSGGQDTVDQLEIDPESRRQQQGFDRKKATIGIF